MSDVIRERIAVLQHRRRQQIASAELSKLGSGLGEVTWTPIASAKSLEIQQSLLRTLTALRERHSLVTEIFRDKNAALAAFHRRIAPSGDVIFEVYRAGAGSGFFEGIPSEGLLRACLASGYEGVAVVSSSLQSGTVLDVVRDDPLEGNFFEVESW